MSSLIERDYVMRLIKRLAELIAQALKLSKSGKHEEAQALLESGCQSVLGMPYGALALVDSASAAELLAQPHRIKAFAQLLEAAAEIAPSEAARRAKMRHALEMWREAVRRAAQDGEAGEALRRLEPLVDGRDN